MLRNGPIMLMVLAIILVKSHESDNKCLTLFWTEIGSLHALQNSLPRFLHRFSPGNSLTLSAMETFKGSLDTLPFPFFAPFGGLLATFLFLERSDGVGLLSHFRMLATL